MAFRLKKIFINKSIVDEPLTRRVLARCSGIPFEVIDDGKMKAYLDQITLAMGKRILYMTWHPGEMVKPCPGTLPPYLCCRYTVINQMIQCPIDCTYCILQNYLESPVVTLYVNFSDVFRSVNQLLSDQPSRFFRFGTGELTDSLALDHLTEFSKDFIHFFSKKRNALIEFKTKTVQVGNLLNSSSKNVVVSWSLNPQKIVSKEEFLSSRLQERLLAAQQCQERGFLLGFHFDPILWVPKWEALYSKLIQQIFSYVDGSRIAWISLGSLRYPFPLKKIIQQRFTQTRIIYEEVIQGMDGKMRYPKPMRVEMYQKIYGWLKDQDPDLFVYFCMESAEIWDRVMGTHPESNEELDFWFARHLWERFPELEMDEPDRESYT